METKIFIEDGLSLYKKSGIGQYTINFFELAKQAGLNVEIKRKPFLEKIKNAVIKRILYILWLNTVFIVKMLLNKYNAVVFTNTLIPFIKLPNIKYYPVLHDLWTYKAPKTTTQAQNLYHRLSIASLKKNAEKIITISETAKQEIVDFFGVDGSKINIVYNHFSFGENPTIEMAAEEQQALLNKLGIQSKKYILSVGNLNKRKNLQTLVDAFNKINSGLKLVLPGAKHSQNFSNLNNNIIFPGYLTDDELKVLYKNALIYVFPSVYEGFGIPLIDAQSFNIPVICSDIEVFKEIGNNTVDYFSLEQNNLDSILENMINNEQLRQKFIELGKENIKRFNKNTIANQIKECY